MPFEPTYIKYYRSSNVEDAIYDDTLYAIVQRNQPIDWSLIGPSIVLGLPASGVHMMVGNASDVFDLTPNKGENVLSVLARLRAREHQPNFIAGNISTPSFLLNMVPKHKVLLVVPNVAGYRHECYIRSRDPDDLYAADYAATYKRSSIELYNRILHYVEGITLLVHDMRLAQQPYYVRGNWRTLRLPIDVHIDFAWGNATIEDYMKRGGCKVCAEPIEEVVFTADSDYTFFSMAAGSQQKLGCAFEGDVVKIDSTSIQVNSRDRWDVDMGYANGARILMKEYVSEDDYRAYDIEDDFTS